MQTYPNAIPRARAAHAKTNLLETVASDVPRRHGLQEVGFSEGLWQTVQRSQVSRSFKACVRRDHSASRDVECTPAACSVAAMPRSQELTCVSVLVSESPNIQDEDWDDEDTEDVDDDYDRQWAPACTQSL